MPKVVNIQGVSGGIVNILGGGSKDYFKTTIASKNYHRPKTTGEC